MLLKLLTVPLTAPIAGFTFILHTIEDMAERELYDVDRIRDDLLLLQLHLDEGEISEEEYEEREQEIMARLRAARAYREQQARR
jgi:hypothetical protein